MATIAILYILFDVNYFLKFLFILVWGRLFDRNKKLLDTFTFYGKFLSYWISVKEILLKCVSKFSVFFVLCNKFICARFVIKKYYL